MDQIPEGLSRRDEYEAVRRMQYHERKQPTLDWLMSLREWITRADLTFPSLAAPERAEKCVREWLRKAAPGCWAIVGYERQERGAVHAHVVIDWPLDLYRAEKQWNTHAGWCRIAEIKNRGRSLAYAVKHAIKDGDFDVWMPGGVSKLQTTGVQRELPIFARKNSAAIAAKEIPGPATPLPSPVPGGQDPSTP